MSRRTAAAASRGSGGGHGLLRRLLLLLFLLSAVQAALNASELPALSAAWFGLDGEARLYLPTWQIMWIHVGVAAALVAGFWLVPERWIDVPPSDRRPDPRAALLRLSVWFGIVTLLALTALMQLVYDANRQPIPALAIGRVGMLAAAYGLFAGVWGALWRRTRREALRALAGGTERPP